MTQPPDDAALVAQNRALRTLNTLLEQEIADHRPKAQEYYAATQTLDSEREANAILTTALEAKDRRIAEADEFIGMVSRLTHSGDDGWFPEGDHDTLDALDALIAKARILRGAALEPSDKGVGR